MPDPDDDDEGCLSVPGESFPTGRADWARVTGLDADGSADHHRGHRAVRPDAATRDRSPGRLPVPRPVGRAQCACRQAGGEVQRLGGAGAVLDAGRRARPVRPLAVSPLPSVGTRVSIRYRLPAGVGAADDRCRRVSRGGRADGGGPHQVRRRSSTSHRRSVVSVRELSHVPVRTSEIRALEHAAALAWPGVEQQWLHGWFLRAGRGVTSRANSAVPLDFSAQLSLICRRSSTGIARAGCRPGWPCPSGCCRCATPVHPAHPGDGARCRRLCTDAAGADPSVTLLPRPTRPGWRSTSATSRRTC